MKIKDILNKTFGYTPENTYNFYLPDNTVANQNTDESPNIFANLSKNLDYIKTRIKMKTHHLHKTGRLII